MIVIDTAITIAWNIPLFPLMTAARLGKQVCQVRTPRKIVTRCLTIVHKPAHKPAQWRQAGSPQHHSEGDGPDTCGARHPIAARYIQVGPEHGQALPQPAATGSARIGINVAPRQSCG